MVVNGEQTPFASADAYARGQLGAGLIARVPARMDNGRLQYDEEAFSRVQPGQVYRLDGVTPDQLRRLNRTTGLFGIRQ
jgi:hypothetical protein